MNALTTLVGLIGWPVAHSVSPAMHSAAFAERGLNWAYAPLPVAPDPAERVGEAVRGLRALGLRGANVTVPHKQAVIAHLDTLSPAARAIGAVNTILVDAGGRLVGDNTDAAGFAADLAGHRLFPIGATALVLGAGGSARAVVYALGQGGAARVIVANRSPERSAALVDAMQPLFANCALEAQPAPDALREAARDATLIVNCTTVGMTPQVEGSPWPADVALRADQAVYDLVYNPMETRLLTMASAQGARAVGGLGMLVHQAALAFERWTGIDAPVEVMRRAALAHFAAQRERP